MTSILFGSVRIYRPWFKCNYLKNEKVLLDFLVHILEPTLNFKHFEKKDDRHSYFISEITDCERLG